jgi:hypothetical protein
MHASWATVLTCLKNEPDHYRFLDAGQLVKHYLGLKHTFANRAITLLYLYWEPENPAVAMDFQAHRAEIAAFGESVHDPALRFRAVSYPELWEEWVTQPTPNWVAGHVEELRARYSVTL